MTVEELVNKLNTMPATAEVRIVFEEDIDCGNLGVETEEIDAPIGEVEYDGDMVLIKEGE